MGLRVRRECAGQRDWRGELERGNHVKALAPPLVNDVPRRRVVLNSRSPKEPNDTDYDAPRQICGRAKPNTAPKQLPYHLVLALVFCLTEALPPL